MRKFTRRNVLLATPMEGMLDRIEREIALFGDLSDEQQHRLLEIAERFPVHRTLVSEVQICTRLIAGPSSRS